MEHRYSSRANTDVKMLIYRGGLPVAIGRIRNCSLHGMYVESEYGQVHVNQPLEIEWIAESAGGETQRCKTVVVHKSGKGLGLEVDPECAASRAAVASLLADGQFEMAPYPGGAEYVQQTLMYA